MRRLRMVALGLALGTLLVSSAEAQSSLEQKLQAKLAKKFVKNAPWITDYDKALATAKESGKVIFAYFTRSYSP